MGFDVKLAQLVISEVVDSEVVDSEDFSGQSAGNSPDGTYSITFAQSRFAYLRLTRTAQ